MLATNMTSTEYAKYKLIIAAIKLFGESGIDSVSLREINRVAGAKNNSALHYHFKNKIGLVEAVIDFIQSEFDNVRGSEFTDLEVKISSEAVSADDVMNAFIRTYVAVIEDNDWGHNAIRALARMEFDGDDSIHKLLNNSAGPAVRNIFKLLKIILPDLPPKLLKRRINFSMNAVINGFANHKNLRYSYLGNLSVKNLRQLADSYQSMSVALLIAPES